MITTVGFGTLLRQVGENKSEPKMNEANYFIESEYNDGVAGAYERTAACKVQLLSMDNSPCRPEKTSLFRGYPSVQVILDRQDAPIPIPKRPTRQSDPQFISANPIYLPIRNPPLISSPTPHLSFQSKTKIK